jgi:Ca2+-binding EF-hand superfamily protein
MTAIPFAVAVACTLYVATCFATEADEYRRRAAQRDVAMFDALDRNKDGRLAIEEVRGNVDLEARFNDFDINRDGVITREELTRYIALHYGIVTAPN